MMSTVAAAASSTILLILLLLSLYSSYYSFSSNHQPSSSSSSSSSSNSDDKFIHLLNFPPLLPLLVASSSALLFLIWIKSSKGKGGQQHHEQGKGKGKGKGKGILPPGNQGIPLIGETLRLIAAYKTENPEPFIDDRVRRNGSRLFTSHVFGERTVFSADPEFNRVVVGGEGRTFECSYPSSISNLLGRYSLVLMKGSLHKRMHSLTLTRFASLSVLRRSLLPDIDRLVSSTLDSWPVDGDGDSAAAAAATKPLLLLDQAKKITFELTVKQLMSYDPGEWTEALRREYLLLIDGFFSIPFPSFLSFTTYGRAIQVLTLLHRASFEGVRHD